MKLTKKIFLGFPPGPTSAVLDWLEDLSAPKSLADLDTSTACWKVFSCQFFSQILFVMLI